MLHPLLTPREAGPADPVFVLCAARTGSTLLRFLLDAHPDLACPPETELPSLCAQLAKTWSLLAGTPLQKSRTGEPTVLPGSLTASIRSTMGQMIGEHLARRGKRRLCDKSMSTAKHASLLLQVFPEAKFICLYRHPMDMIASGIEACPWGLKGFGFDSYAAGAPGSDVLALARYWTEHTKEIRAVEERYPQACHRVRYEDLVQDPEAAADGLFRFLGVSSSPGISARCFSPERERLGPGDYKIWRTSRISPDSVGRGWSLPVDQIEPPARARMNELAGELGYVQVDERWSVAATPPDLRVAGPGAVPVAPAPDATTTREMPRWVLQLGDRLQAGVFRVSDRFTSRWASCARDSFLVMASSAADGGSVARWRVDLAARTVTLAGRPGEADGVISWQLTGSDATWGQVLSGAANLNVALRHRELRYCDTGTVPASVTVARVDMLADLLGVTSWRPDEELAPLQAFPLQAPPAALPTEVSAMSGTRNLVQARIRLLTMRALWSAALMTAPAGILSAGAMSAGRGSTAPASPTPVSATLTADLALPSGSTQSAQVPLPLTRPSTAPQIPLPPSNPFRAAAPETTPSPASTPTPETAPSAPGASPAPEIAPAPPPDGFGAGAQAVQLFNGLTLTSPPPTTLPITGTYSASGSAFAGLGVAGSVTIGPQGMAVSVTPGVGVGADVKFSDTTGTVPTGFYLGLTGKYGSTFGEPGGPQLSLKGTVNVPVLESSADGQDISILPVQASSLTIEASTKGLGPVDQVSVAGTFKLPNVSGGVGPDATIGSSGDQPVGTIAVKPFSVGSTAYVGPTFRLGLSWDGWLNLLYTLGDAEYTAATGQTLEQAFAPPPLSLPAPTPAPGAQPVQYLDFTTPGSTAAQVNPITGVPDFLVGLGTPTATANAVPDTLAAAPFGMYTQFPSQPSAAAASQPTITLLGASMSDWADTISSWAAYTAAAPNPVTIDPASGLSFPAPPGAGPGATNTGPASAGSTSSSWVNSVSSWWTAHTTQAPDPTITDPASGLSTGIPATVAPTPPGDKAAPAPVGQQTQDLTDQAGVQVASATTTDPQAAQSDGTQPDGPPAGGGAAPAADGPQNPTPIVTSYDPTTDPSAPITA